MLIMKTNARFSRIHILIPNDNSFRFLRSNCNKTVCPWETRLLVSKIE